VEGLFVLILFSELTYFDKITDFLVHSLPLMPVDDFLEDDLPSTVI
jgi:hypothetical protein